MNTCFTGFWPRRRSRSGIWANSRGAARDEPGYRRPPWEQALPRRESGERDKAGFMREPNHSTTREEENGPTPKGSGQLSIIHLFIHLFIIYLFETGPHVSQVGLKLTLSWRVASLEFLIFLPLPPKS